MSLHPSVNLVPQPTGELSVRTAAADGCHLSLILPTYTEADNIATVIAALVAALDPQYAGHYELIVVDDNSPDGTWAIAGELATRYSCLRVIRRLQERGLSSAVIRGWQASRGDVVGVIDADLQHPPQVVTTLLTEIDAGADLAVASRHVAGGGVSVWSPIRRLLSRGAQLIGLLLLPEVIPRVSDPMSGFFLVRRSLLQGRLLRPVGYKILIELLARCPIGAIAEQPYIFEERQHGTSKVSWRHYRDYLRHLLRLRFYRWGASRFIRFALVGLGGSLVDMGLFFLLSSPMGAGLTLAKAIAAEVAVIHNFFWNNYWTFGDISARRRGIKPLLLRLVRFNAIALAGLAINIAVLNLVFRLVLPQRLIANAIAIAVTTLWNFFMNKRFNWRATG